MVEIINLRQARKRKARAKANAAAKENRILHGRTKAEKQREARRKDCAGAVLDQAKIETAEWTDPKDEDSA